MSATHYKKLIIRLRYTIYNAVIFRKLCLQHTTRNYFKMKVHNLGYVHTNTDGRRRTFFCPSVAVVAFIPTRTAPDRRKKNGAYKETEADVVVVVETKGEQGALYPQIFCAPC